MQGPDQDSQEAAGEAAGPAPALATDAWALLQLDGPPRACRAASTRLAGAARNKSFREKVRGAAGGLCGPVSRGQVGFISEKRKVGDGGGAFVRWSRHDHSLVRGHPHHGRPQSRGRGRGCQAVMTACPMRTSSLSSVFLQPRCLFGL